MPVERTDQTALLHRLLGAEPGAAAAVLAEAAASESASCLVAAAMLWGDAAYLARAGAAAATPRERRLVVLAEARLRGDTDRFDALVRDHLAEHPDHLLAAWVAGQQPPPKEHTMSHASTLLAAPRGRTAARTVARWMVTFVGFPLGGYAAYLLTGPVDSTGAAVAGGLVTGAVLGAVQAWALRVDRRQLAVWVLATAVGLAVGLALGASLVDFRTGLADLALQGAVTGLAVGAAQAVVLLPRTGPVALVLPVWLAAVWALGWVVSTSIGIRVDEQFTVFGSSGALTATLLTAVVPVVLGTRASQP